YQQREEPVSYNANPVGSIPIRSDRGPVFRYSSFHSGFLPDLKGFVVNPDAEQPRCDLDAVTLAAFQSSLLWRIEAGKCDRWATNSLQKCSRPTELACGQWPIVCSVR